MLGCPSVQVPATKAGAFWVLSGAARIKKSWDVRRRRRLQSPKHVQMQGVEAIGCFLKTEVRSSGQTPSSNPLIKSSSESKNGLKWTSYGGCIPSILQALDTNEDIEDALRPWVLTLSNKERSIILKEQTRWDRALEIFEWFKGKGCYEVNVIHYNIMLRIVGKARKWCLVISLWCEMQAKGVTPTNSTYGTLIDVFSKGGLCKESLVWLSDMFKKGLQPDEVTIGVVLQTYKKAGEFGLADQFFKRWSSASRNSLSDSKCCSAYTFNTLIDTYGKAGQLKEASETFAEMLRQGIVPNTVTFNTMIHVCGNHGRLQEVSNLLAAMEAQRCLADTRTYNILISIYLKADIVDRAAECFTEMKKVGLTPDAVSFRTLLYAYSIRQKVKQSEALVLEMEERGIVVDEYTQSALTRMYIDVGMLAESWSWFEKFQDTMSSECYAANIDAFGAHGHLCQAEKVFSICLEKKRLSSLVFNVMIKIYGIVHEYDKACEIFDTMEHLSVLPDKCTYNSIIQILSVAERPEKATAYVRKMHKDGIVSDCIPYSAVISSFTKIGNLKMAVCLFNEMVRLRVQPDIIVFGVLINAFVESGSVEEAKNSVKLMEMGGFTGNSIIYSSLIKLYTRARLLDEAQKTYECAKSLDDGPDTYSSNCMVELYCENDMISEAEEVFQGLKERGFANEFSFSTMIRLYNKAGLLSRAFAVAEEMLGKCVVTDVLSYNTLIELFALKGGRLKRASETLEKMVKLDIKPNAATFKLLGISLINMGVSKEAIHHLELVRKKDNNLGLQVWIRTIHTILGIGTTKVVGEPLKCG